MSKVCVTGEIQKARDWRRRAQELGTRLSPWKENPGSKEGGLGDEIQR